MSKFVIIDGNAIIHRAYHALPPMTTKDGKMVNAVYGFTSMLLKVWRDLHPDYLAVTFDVAGGSTARLKKFAKYKATRVKADQELYDQIPLVHEVVSAFSLPIFEMKGYEADDVIGTMVKEQKAKSKEQIEIYIVTGDMDTLQLVDTNVKVYGLRKGMSDIVIYDSEEVKKRYGFGPDKIVDYKSIRGDASDNIPGVPGIGEKGATELILKYGSLDNIYKQADSLSLRGATKERRSNPPNSGTDVEIRPNLLKKLEEGKESAFMSRELATLDCAVPGLNFKLEDCRVKPFDRAKVVDIFHRLEFVSLLKRVPGMEGMKMEAKDKPAAPNKKAGELKFKELASADEVAELTAKIQKQKCFVCRAIVSSPDYFSAQLLGLVVVADNEGVYIKNKFLSGFFPIFSDKDIELAGHNLKQLIKILKLQKIEVANQLFDAMIAAYLLNPGSRATDLSSIILKVLGKELPVGAGQGSLFGADARLAADELCLLNQAVEMLKSDLNKVNNFGLFEKIEMPLVGVLAEMELNGVAVDTKILAGLSQDAAVQNKKITREIYDLAGEEFNISSPLQLREVLFEKMNIPIAGVKKGKTGLSTSAEELEKLRGLHPIIDKISEYRELAKLQNTYLDVLPTLINKITGRIHTTFNQAVTATGRLSSSDPNLQNIPIRTPLGREIRKAFIAADGYKLVSADYSQIELRIVASLAKDKNMMEIFEKDEDIHSATAAAINGVALKDVTKEMRRAAKEVNFGILYGMGAYGLSWRAEIPQWQAKEFIAKYFAQFSGVKKYIDQTLAFTKKEGFCETLFGRRRYLPELNSANFQLRSAAERMAINHPVQGTAADLMKLAMIKVHEEIKHVIASEAKQSQGDRHVPTMSGLALTSPVKMILQVHDELVLEVKNEMVESMSKLVKEEMENVVKLNVPVKVDVHAGDSWGGIK